jgi:beta-galactosidase
MRTEPRQIPSGSTTFGHGKQRRTVALLMLGVSFATVLTSTPAWAQRVRSSINDGWKFHRGDPPGAAADLRYEVLPELKLRPDGADFDAGVMDDSDTAVRKGILRPYILPSGNAFIRDPARRHQRPPGNPGGDVPYVGSRFDDAGWTSVSLPHDWAIAGPFITAGPYGGMGRLPSWGAGWYRRKLDIPVTDRGRSVFLDVDGAMSYATVWLNGKLVGGWPYGYNSWRLDLTPHVIPGGDNQLAIRLDNPMESSRWYPGGGIYRNVWLTVAEPVHVAQWGTKITTSDVSARQAQVALQLTVENLAAADTRVVADTEIFAINAKDQRLGRAVARIAPATIALTANGTASITGTTQISNPRLWGPPPHQTPNRYVAVTTLKRDGRTVDRYETRFGVRSLTFDPARGVNVNGEHIMLNGVNQHHDLGALGAAWNDRAAQRQLDILADMGVNAIRMAHNPPAPELLDMTDRMGLLVMDEVFDVWERRKTPFDTHLIFKDWHEPDLRAMMRRDYNHPSVIMWSIGNEVGEQYGGRGAAVAREVVAIAHEEDSSRPVMGSMNISGPGSDFANAFDAIALNYQGAGVRTKLPTFAGFRAQHPDKVIFSSESAAAYSSRGDYQFPVPGGISNPVRPGVGGDETTHQVSAYELFSADFGGSADRTWAAQDQNPTVAGEFVWTGFDYLGEPAPYYSSRSSYFGIVDLAGFPKDRFWLYKARWRPDVKFVHVLPHWSFPGREGQVTPVHAFSSADEAELFVNGVSQGRQKRAPFAYRFRWDYVRYAPGEIKVVTWKDGKPWAEEAVRTTGAPAHIAAVADRSTLNNDGKDLVWVNVALNDAKGGFVPTDHRTIRFIVDGPGEVIATDNGDPGDFTAFPSLTRKLFNGRATAIVRALPGKVGSIRIRVMTNELPEETVVVQAKETKDSKR